MCMVVFERQPAHAPYGATKKCRSVNLNYKAGGVLVNAQLVEDFDIKKGMYMSIARESESGEYYLRFSNEQGYPMLPRKDIRKSRKLTPGIQSTKYFRCVNHEAVKAILESIGCTGSATFAVSRRAKVDNGIKWYRIITEKPLKVNNQQFNL